MSITFVLSGAVAGCKKDEPKPDPARTQPAPASTEKNPAPVDSTRKVPAPIEERTPLETRDGEKKSLSLVAVRMVEFQLGQQRSDAFDVWSMTEKGGGQKLVVVQGGFTFTQAQPGVRGPLALETKTITGGPVAAANEIARLEGVWPDALLASATFASFLGARQHSSSKGDFERVDGKWAKVKALPDSTAVLDDAVLALQAGKLSAYRGTPGVLPEQAKPPAESACATAETHLLPYQVAARSGAGVVLVGTVCRTGPFGVERFLSGQPKGTVEELPDAPKNELGKGASFHASIGSAANVAVWLSGSAGEYLALARRGPFRKVPLPVPGKLVAAVATPDDALFVLIDPAAKGDRIVFRLVEGVWTRWDLPTDAGRTSEVETLFAADRDTAIVGGSLSGGGSTHAAALFATFEATLLGKPKDIRNLLELDKPAAAPAPAASSAPATPVEAAPVFPAFTDACATPFVYIFDVSKSAPADFAFPSTKKALATFASVKDVKVVEVMHQGKRRLGAHVKDAAMGRELVTHIAANMKDEKPLLVCFSPSSEREITLP